MRRITFAVVALSLLATGVSAQSLQDRIDRVRQAQQREQVDRVVRQRIARARIEQKLGYVVKDVNVDKATLRQTFKWWATNTTIPLVIDWNDLELEGVNPQQEISIDLKAVPSGKLLALILKMVESANEVEMIYEVTPWYIEVLTKRMANKRTMVRVYPISDLIMAAPNFRESVPRMDLESALDQGSGRGNSRGGSGGGGGGGDGIFGDNDDDREMSRSQSSRERAESLAQLIRDTIEPEIWQANGGEFSSIRYIDGRLIIKAPLYVHRQIGPSPRVGGGGGGAAAAGGGATGTAGKAASSSRGSQRGVGDAGRRSKVSGISQDSSTPTDSARRRAR